jgi:replicative DNA helicase
MNLESLNKDRNRRKVDSGINYGKVPPQAKEIEEVVLGAIMIDKRAFDIISEILRPECFYVESHQLIFQAMVKLNQRSQVIEIFSVVEELMKMESLEIVGGPYYVTKLTNSVVSTAALEQHARIVLEKYMKREIIRIGMEMIGDGYEDSIDVFELLDKSENSVFAIGNSFLKKDFQKLQEVGAKVVNRLDTLMASNEIISGVPSGFTELDRITYGWQSTDLIILAARPSVGKTAFALNLARNAASNLNKKTPVGFFSLEMSAEQLVQRLLSAESGVFMNKINQGKMDEQDYLTIMNKGIKKFDEMDIYIDDSAALNIFEFRAKARRMVDKHNVGIIIIDYLQLMSGLKDRNGNREQEISTISRNLKALAKELHVPIIALSQLSRDVEKRGGKKEPQLADLRESGAIEQDADMVMFMYRPEYYEIKANEMGDSTHGLTELKIAKHRNGSLGTIKLKAVLPIQKFYDWKEEESTPSVPGYIPVKNFDDGWDKPI